MIPVFAGKYKSGLLKLNDSTGEVLTVLCDERFSGFLKGLDGKDVEVTIQPRTKIRSDSQHGLHRIWCRIIADYTGHSADRIHRLAKKKAGFVEIIRFGDEVYEDVKSQKVMTTVEMAAVMMELERMAGFLGLQLPRPEDLAELREKKQRKIRKQEEHPIA